MTSTREFWAGFLTFPLILLLLALLTACVMSLVGFLRTHTITLRVDVQRRGAERGKGVPS